LLAPAPELSQGANPGIMWRKKILRRRASEHLSMDIREVIDCSFRLEKVEQWTFHSAPMHKTEEGAFWGGEE